MFVPVPENNALGLAMALGALCCWGSWSVTLVLASEGMAFQQYYLNFTISFLLTGFVVGYLGGSLGSGGEAYGFSTPYLEEILTGHEYQCDLWAISGGVTWNIANILLCKGIGMMGNATGFPLCVGLGMVTGAIVGYAQERTSNLAFLVPGVLVALCGIFTVGFLSYRKEQELAAPAAGPDESSQDSEEDSGSGSNDVDDAVKPEANKDHASMARKLLVCIVGGLLLGLSNIGVGKATGAPCRLSPYANQTYFSIGVFACSAVMVPIITIWPIEGNGGTSIFPLLRQHCSVKAKYHFLAALGGFVLCAGFFFFNLGNKPLSLTTTYCIGQSAPLVGILWGTFFFKEFSGTSMRVKGLIPVVCILFASAIVLIAAAG